MATLALSLVGQFAGAMVGGPFGATIGRALGALAGNAVDGMLFGEKREGRAFDVRLVGSVEGAPIPRLYGWGRLAGNIIWARELERLGGETAGAKAMGGPEDEEIGASFAIGFCEGEVARLGRIWADGQLLDTRGLNLRFYRGDAEQSPDSLIEATQGLGNAPAYRGLCYLVFENLPLSRFGNRIPQISAELCRVVGELEPAIRAITVIPGATEFGYDPVPRLLVLGPGQGRGENSHLLPGVSNWTASIDELADLCPNLKHVALLVTWFGDDLRCGQCRIGPRVEAYGRTVEGVEWHVAGLARDDVPVVSYHDGGPAYGGTPSDAAVRAAIADLRARGFSVTLYPLIMMDVPAGNGLDDPYGWGEQANYPWRGRITCHPAPGLPGSPDGTADAAAQVAAFLPDYRAMVLHYAGIAAETGVEALLIGSEMRGLTTVRGAGNSFPFVAALVDLVAEARAVVGAGTKLSYAADWSEYSGYQPEGQKFFHLDPLWATPEIDAVGIDCYMPAADWRDGEGHADEAGASSAHDLDYLGRNIAGGEGFDWFYLSDADRAAQVRTPITDGAHGEPWVWRYKDIAAFWSQRHFDRPGGVRATSPTAWVPASKPIWLTELGCAAVDKGANQPNIFGDPKSAEGGRPYFSSGVPDLLIQRQYLRAHFRHWTDAENNPAGMVDPERIYCWTWDARPYPAFPAEDGVWADGPNHNTGHWLTGRLGGAASDEVIAAVAADHGCAIVAAAEAPLIGGMVLSGPGRARDALEPLLEVTGQSLLVRDGVLTALPAGRGAAIMLDAETLARLDAPVITRRRSAAAERPARLALSHIDRARDYLSASATAIRPGAGPMLSEGVDMVLDAAGARLAAERLLDRRAVAGDSVELALPPNCLVLEPGDRIALPELAEGPFEIVEIRDGAARRITARGLSRGDAVATGVDRPPAVQPLVTMAATPALVAAHLPGEGAQSRLVVGAFASPWPGGVRVTDESTGAALADLGRPAAMGEMIAGIGAGPTALWDRGSALSIRLYGGHLADGAEMAVLAGSNRLAVETDAGDWEIIGFAGAELTGPGEYRLTRLLRGLEGTCEAMGPVSPGRRVLVLDGRAGVLPVAPGQLGEARMLRLYAGGADLVGQGLVVAPGLAPALPLAPGHLRATRQAGDAIGFSWLRRSRGDADGWGVAETPSDVVPERYRLRIFEDATLLRSVDVDMAGATYTLAEQLADFGGVPSHFRFAVAQMSPVLGPGHWKQGEFDE
ncbi:MAG: glycoside hydrolase/phage tail family protein [Devosia sp.]|nr:glycoside hydrolase/phage tail family protein [Devosia sp.]